MGAPKNRGYKRSWKNYLLNARYQLLFTLTMVTISGLLIAGLGWWVMRAADKATTVSMDNVLGVACQRPDVAVAGDTRESAAVPVEVEVEERPAAEANEPAPADANAPAAADANEPAAAEANAPAAADDRVAEPPEPPEPPERGGVVVDIVEEDVPPPPPPVGALARYHMCRVQQASTIQRLRTNRDRILYVLIGVGALLCIGLAVYGIKMTHKVAGPLHKVGLYFAKMRDGKYDTVYNLRKGDQLIAFYAHFKDAHEGMRKVETEDVEMLRALIAAADAGAGELSAEARAALDELRAVLDTKENAIG